MRNLKLAFRTLFKSPFVTAVAVLSLALGIGANAAIFSVFDRILLQSLPVAEPERLVNLSAPGPMQGSTSCNQAGDCDEIFSYLMFRDLAAAETAFEGIAGHRPFGANIAYEGQTLNGGGTLVSGSYFPLLGLRPALGRLFTPDDDRNVGGHPVTVLSHAFWQTRLGGSRDVLERSIVINGSTFTIIGVAPAGFEGTTLGSEPRVFVPLSMRAQVSPGFDGFDDRRAYWVYLFARLEPGVSMAQAQASINAVYQPILNDVEAPLQQGLSEQTMAQFRAKQVLLADGRRGQSSVHGEARTPLLMLLVTTGIVLLIACANIANLLLARGANRGMEMAIRLSLGATRRQVLGQLLTESVVLAVLGGMASLFVARGTLGVITSIMPPEAADSLQLGLRTSASVFTAALSIGTGLLFGMFPALHSTRPDLVSTIRANAGNLTVTRAATRFRTTLVTAQIALSMTLLITAGLFLKSLQNVSRQDLGLRIDNIITFRVSPQLNAYTPERSRVLFTRLEEELAALPGVTHVTTSLVPILSGSNWGSNVSVEGFQADPDTDTGARFNEIGLGYFNAFDIPLIAGREFTAADVAGGAKVAIVNEAFARKFNLGREPVGKLMATGAGGELDMQIVGFVRDAKYSRVKDAVPPLFFTPWRQDETIGSLSFYVRTSGDATPVLRGLTGVVAGLDANLPVEDLKTMPQQVRENIFLDRIISSLSAAFAALATLLAAVGLYGVLAYSVARRTREFGVRMALGADGGYVRSLVLRQVGWMFAIGGSLGILAALGLGRAARSLLFGLEGNDPIVIVSATAMLALFALAAGFVPAFRASRVDPIKALRYE